MTTPNPMLEIAAKAMSAQNDSAISEWPAPP